MQRDILVIEDDRQISEIIKAYLEKDQWKVDCAFDGNEGIRMFDKSKYEAVILDLMLAGVSGDDICRYIRKKSDVPIVFLTAKAKEQDKINGLYLGADDYLTKPFSPKELVARVYAVVRRYKLSMNERDIKSYDNGGLVIDNDKSQVVVDGRVVEFTSTEYKIVSVLAGKPQYIFTRNDLVYYVLNSRYAGDGRIIDAHIKNIRRKMETVPNHPRYVVTVIGKGYKFGVEADEIK